MSTDRRPGGARRPRVRPGRALTRSSVRRGARPPAPEPEPSRLRRLLNSPLNWLLAVVLVVATTTFQDVLGSTLGALLPLDRVPDRVAAGEAIDVVTVRSEREIGTWMARDATVSEIDAALEDPNWPRELDLIDVGWGSWIITLEGRAQQQVRITDIVPELENGRCGEPLTGPLLLTAPEGGGPVVQLQVDIDQPGARLHGSTDTGEDTGPYFTGPTAQHVTLDRNESVAFRITARADQGHCRWTYRVEYEVAGAAHTTRIDGPDGAPFEITAPRRDAADYPVVWFSPQGCGPGPEFSAERVRGTGEDYARALEEFDAPVGQPVSCPEHLRR
ncbi:hypothetical protein FH609_001660 [Streptomyces sp. 3MP-14]|uniref:Uncharacterized protein n=1 Tax=Streptomyces mimosae TaxID=2586635 RepID=A0A5N6AQG5_9ACTN|nr:MULTISPECIES: hypothetical protein [Streptomyces]KAB8170921.1 hypothetical protein FH607_000810 [Streptomyces mimosae]KAB8179728.1 hypothetical protein FH609_001660 [Streptomyces sp. 3MP-14]